MTRIGRAGWKGSYCRLIGCVVLVFGLTPPLTECWAQPAAPDSRETAARGKLVEGDTSLKRGDFPGALAAFKEAYALFASPKIQYNFGLAYQGMGRNADAIEAFEAFLQGAPDASADVRANARTTRDGLLNRVGTLHVAADVEGAVVVVDGREMGKTPLAQDVRLDPGPHLLLVDSKTGSPPYTRRLEILAGVGASVVVALANATPANTTPANARPANTTPANTTLAVATPPVIITSSPALPPATSPSNVEAGGRGRPWHIAGIAIAAGGAVAIGGGLLLGLAARSASHEVSMQYDSSRDSAGKRDESLQWVGYGVGAAALAAGAFLFAHGSRLDSADGAAIHAFVTPRFLMVQSRFR